MRFITRYCSWKLGIWETRFRPFYVPFLKISDNNLFCFEKICSYIFVFSSTYSWARSAHRGCSFPSALSWFDTNELRWAANKKFENGTGSRSSYSCKGKYSTEMSFNFKNQNFNYNQAPEGEPQPSTEIDLFISTEKVYYVNQSNNQ